jgi:hypothetical protein
MISAKKFQRVLILLLPFLFFSSENLFAQNDENDAPDVTARVARISFLNGDVQIKRADQTVWERATNNLPIVEGDEIATSEKSRLEIQFDSANYVRLSENSYLKVTTLRDEGIALSLPNGTMSARVLSFDKDRSYLEIDAPGTTVSVERAGMYRIDAGDQTESEVRIAVTDSGQAHVYSENSGFTLKNGRSATVQLAGSYAGEWQIADAARYADNFDSWSLERDAIIAKRLRDAGFDKYYDRDFYGAEELSEYGEWIYTKKYGYVWKPYRSSTAVYADWSPYRYGQWRWIPPYGWTWVNDEPWGYATYHHGRWVYFDDYWYWSPYPQHRGRRSWWRPALVILASIGSNICWYPLPYGYDYYNYNSYYHRNRRRHNTTIINNNTTVVVVNPTPTPTPTVTVPINKGIPQVGVITVPASDFGRNKSNFRTAPIDLAQKALATAPIRTANAPVLPTFKELNGNVSKDILAPNPKITRAETNIKTGATVRESGVSAGETLRKERIYGNRAPVEKVPRTENQEGGTEQNPVRNTGAIKRQPRSETPVNNDAPIRQMPSKDSSPNGSPIRQTGGIRTEPNDDGQTPVKPRREREMRDSTPRVEQPEQRIERPQPPRRERQPDPPREEPVRPEPPRREERQQEPVRPEPPRPEPVRPDPPSPPKQEPPPPAEKPSAPSEVKGRDKDG